MSKTVWTVTYQDDQVSALNSEQVRVFDERDSARFYALELAKQYNYVNMYESEVTDAWVS
tara:strand:+ start:510 stop:689 length:180 start_codon:yes stop_codon:yes gene_type:complete